MVADSIGGVRDQEILDLETRIRPPEFDALPAEVRELGPMYRAANPVGTRLWADIEKESRPSMPRTSTLQQAYSVPMRNQLMLSLFEQIHTPALLLTGGADMTAPPALMKLLLRESGAPNSSSCLTPGIRCTGKSRRCSIAPFSTSFGSTELQCPADSYDQRY